MDIKVLKEFGNIGRYKIRAVQYGDSRGIDIREYLETECFTGFTRKGVFIHEEAIPELLEKVQKVKSSLD